MANTPTTATLAAAAMSLVFENNVARSINRAAPTLQVLNKVALQGQKAVDWIVRYGSANYAATAPIAPGADVTNFNRDSSAPAHLPITTYHEAFAYDGLGEAIARCSGSPSDLANMRVEELDTAAERLGSAIAQHLWTGTGLNDQIMGLLDPTSGAMLDTGTYAGIDKGSVTQFQGNVIDAKVFNGGRLTPTLMRAGLTKIFKKARGSKRPTLGVFSADAFDTYAAIFDPQRQYQFVTELSVGGKLIKLDAGVDVMSFAGIPFIRDISIPETTTGTLALLNTNEVMIRYLPQPTSDELMSGVGITVSQDGTMQSMGTGMTGKLIEIARLGDRRRFAIYMYLQVQNRNPNTSLLYTNLALN
jgi:hypothetical protein